MKKLEDILLIDDNEADNEYHETLIKKAEIASAVKSISDSAEAFMYLEDCLKKGKNPELIFLDILMPHLDGFEMVDKYKEALLHENYPLKNIKVFILSGGYDPEMEFYLNSGNYHDLIIGYRQKPLTVEMLHEIVNKYF